MRTMTLKTLSIFLALGFMATPALATHCGAEWPCRGDYRANGNLERDVPNTNFSGPQSSEDSGGVSDPGNGSVQGGGDTGNGGGTGTGNSGGQG